jgi:hyperosmotically inducible protein
MKHKFMTLVLAGGLLAAPAYVFGESPAATGAVVQNLERQVRSQLLKLPYFGVFDNLEFRVDADRKVTLLGETIRPTLKRDAEAAVKRIEGVELVDNQIKVLPVSNFDDNIRVRAYYAVYGHPALNRYAVFPQAPIRIIVDRGNVTLEGVVNSEVERQLAFSRVNGLSGVFSVTNNLKLDNAD